MDDGRYEEYDRRVDPIRTRYQADFAALEARWVRDRQRIVDQGNIGGLVLEGYIEWAGDNADARHEHRVGELIAQYQRDTAAIRQEIGL